MISLSTAQPLTQPVQVQLPNGLTVIAESMPLPVVSFDLWVQAGASVETESEQGMAHFLEHMIFKGSQRLANGEFEQWVEQRGGATNAATSQDYTHYYVTVAPQDFAAVAPHQLDLVSQAQIPTEPFHRERPVILEEIRRAEDSPRRRLFKLAMQMAFTQLPYRRPVLGSLASVSGFTPEQMRQYHQTWYQPQQMTAVVVGHLPVDAMIAAIADGCEQIGWTPDHSGSSVRPEWTTEPGFTEIVRQEVIDESLTQARLMMFWRVPGLQHLTQTYPLDVLARVLGQGRTSRLVKDLRDGQGLVTSISATNLSQQWQGVFAISAQLPVENLARVEAAIAEQITAIQQDSITSKELIQVQRQAANQFVFRTEAPSSRANLYGYYQTVIGDIAPVFTYAPAIQGLTRSEIQVAAQQHLSASAYGIAILRPSA